MKYHIGIGDYYGLETPDDVFNNKMVPRLRELGIAEKDLTEVAGMFEEIYGLGYSNGADNREAELSEDYS